MSEKDREVIRTAYLARHPNAFWVTFGHVFLGMICSIWWFNHLDELILQTFLKWRLILVTFNLCVSNPKLYDMCLGSLQLHWLQEVCVWSRKFTLFYSVYRRTIFSAWNREVWRFPGHWCNKTAKMTITDAICFWTIMLQFIYSLFYFQSLAKRSTKLQRWIPYINFQSLLRYKWLYFSFFTTYFFCLSYIYLSFVNSI